MAQIDPIGSCQGGIAPISCDDGDDGGGGHGDVDNDGHLDTPNNNIPIIEHRIVGYDSGRQWNEGWRGGAGTFEDDDDDDPGCFVGGTPVRMADGSEEPIEEVVVGDTVLAMAMPGGCQSPFERSWKEPGAFGPARVTGIIKGSEKRYVAVNHRLRCSADHPILVRRGETVAFVSACLLHLGDMLIGQSGEREVTHLNMVSTAVRTFNLEVERAHTFIADGVVVHNAIGFGTDPTEGSTGGKVTGQGTGAGTWGSF